MSISKWFSIVLTSEIVCFLFGLNTTETGGHKVSDGIVVDGIIDNFDGGSNPTVGFFYFSVLLGDNSHNEAAFNFCPNVGVHPGAPMLGWGTQQGVGSWSKNHYFFHVGIGRKNIQF